MHFQNSIRFLRVSITKNMNWFSKTLSWIFFTLCVLMLKMIVDVNPILSFAHKLEWDAIENLKTVKI